MPMKRIAMDKVREILRLKEQCDFTERAIARTVNVSRPVVKHYLERLAAAGIDYAAIYAMSDDVLMGILEGDKESNSERYQVLHQKFAAFAKVSGGGQSVPPEGS